MSTVIEVDDVWKKYRLGIIGTGTLRHDFERWWHRVRGKPDPYSKLDQKSEIRNQKSEVATNVDHPISGVSASLGDDEMWALRGVSFEVKQGEILGIIGRNGAGKSTLLKILSRVTAPTSGEVRVKGRIASLLEVGTGFHPELTGRENIFLNGAILGMTKAEIRNKFDEIVDFAGVERYMDTPVKRYSSGMYVRLAFAVAAHLEPEILIVDEVLAVGDAEFQKKCMGKMQDVSKGGRTVLFVSHNMAAIFNLCTKALLLENGRLKSQGGVSEVSKIYAATFKSKRYTNLLEHPERTGEGLVQFTKLWIENKNQKTVDRVSSGDEVVIAAEYKSRGNKPLKNVRASFCVRDSVGQVLLVASTELTSSSVHNLPPEGIIRCIFPCFPLTGSEYQIELYLEVNGTAQDWIEAAGTILVEDGDFYGSGKLYPAGWQGKGVLVEHRWQLPVEDVFTRSLTSK